MAAVDWSPEHDVTPTPDEVDSVAVLLEGMHGVHAADVAEFFATKHSLDGDAGRSWAWNGVAERVRQREQCRLDTNH